MLMNKNDLNFLDAAREAVLNDMLDYLANEGAENAGYQEENVNQVKDVLTTFDTAYRQGVASREAFDALLAPAIEGLNAINDQCDFCLIETGQRELLATYFNRAARLAGVGSESEDVTELLRDW